MLATEVKEHKKAVTCFALFEPGNNLLSGSCDKSIRVNTIIVSFSLKIGKVHENKNSYTIFFLYRFGKRYKVSLNVLK